MIKRCGGISLDASSLQGNRFRVTNRAVKRKPIPPVERHTNCLKESLNTGLVPLPRCHGYYCCQWDGDHDVDIRGCFLNHYSRLKIIEFEVEVINEFLGFYSDGDFHDMASLTFGAEMSCVLKIITRDFSSSSLDWIQCEECCCTSVP
ncbi:hypothetical protein MKW98_012500 [Papaver atlanticum]|uniref:Uncharacterized protein n=1 Tax=Papaver atlanticum TaxID=357466 RepID=A0AAD4SFA7_9MAGN|nr:hypothetical protein MKW98_012500 [Papaver atlanticum]